MLSSPAPLSKKKRFILCIRATKSSLKTLGKDKIIRRPMRKFIKKKIKISKSKFLIILKFFKVTFFISFV